MNQEIPPTKEQPVEEETKRQFDNMGDALRAGKDEGSAKAREAAPGLKSCIAEAFHDLAYGVAYGAFSPSVEEDVVELIEEGSTIPQTI